MASSRWTLEIFQIINKGKSLRRGKSPIFSERLDFLAEICYFPVHFPVALGCRERIPLGQRVKDLKEIVFQFPRDLASKPRLEPAG